MSSKELAARRRAEAAELEKLADLEESLDTAKAAYRKGYGDKEKQTYLEAADALRAARQEIRESGVGVAADGPGSTTVVPATVSGRGAARGQEG